MKILMLSCSTGEGHNAAGEAVREAMKKRGHQADLIDVMSLGGEKCRHDVSQAYIDTVKYAPWFFGFLYILGGAISGHSTLEHHSPVYWANSFLADKLASYIKWGGYDAVVCSHLYAAEILTCLRQRDRLDIPFISVGTDYTLIPFWEETACDAFAIPHRDCAAQYISRGIPESKIFPSGIPVRAEFKEALKMDVEYARQKLGLPSSGTIALLMGGSMGFGNMLKTVRHLDARLGPDEFAVVICGTNHALEQDLRHHFGGSSQIRIVGYSARIAEYMRASDIIVTKPGGITSTEAAFMKLPIVHSEPIPGCEDINRDFFRVHGMSVSGETVREQLENGWELLHNPGKREDIRRCQQFNINPLAAEDICLLTENLVTEPDRQKAVNESLLFRPARSGGEGAI